MQANAGGKPFKQFIFIDFKIMDRKQVFGLDEISRRYKILVRHGKRKILRQKRYIAALCQLHFRYELRISGHIYSETLDIQDISVPLSLDMIRMAVLPFLLDIISRTASTSIPLQEAFSPFFSTVTGHFFMQ